MLPLKTDTVKDVSIEDHEAKSTSSAVGELFSWTAEEEKAVLRKIDTKLLPMLLISYMLQFLDKTTLGYAAIMGIIDDNHLVGQQYSWASSAFYFGYLIASYPASIGFVKLPLGKFLSGSMVIWSIILLLHCTSSSFAGLVTLRVLLGVFESTISPGFMLITSTWYKPSEHSLRHGLWYIGNTIASIFGGLISYGIAHATGIASWKVLFILFGGITLSWSIFLVFYLPDSPETAKFLSPEERRIAVMRTQLWQRGKNVGHYKTSQIKEALIDPKTWLLFSFSFLFCMCNGALTNFGSIVIKGFGFTTMQTLLINMGPGVWGLLVTLTFSFGANKIRNSRSVFIFLALCCGLTGGVMLRELPSSAKGAKLVGQFLFTTVAVQFPLTLALMSSNIGGYTKKTVVNALFFVAYCIGNIAGPQVFKTSEAPTYKTAFTTMITCVVLGMLCLIALVITMVFQNKRRDSKYGRVDPYEKRQHEADNEDRDSDMTDWESAKTFRYLI